MTIIKRSKSLGAQLRARGFDLTTYNRSTDCYRLRCSQCEVMVINGIACHETGCPNELKAQRQEEEYEVS